MKNHPDAGGSQQEWGEASVATEEDDLHSQKGGVKSGWQAGNTRTPCRSVPYDTLIGKLETCGLR